jgi:GT2 family glycosyltransferase
MGDPSASAPSQVSVAIPTLGRESVLIDTIRYLLQLEHPALEILVVDQTPVHEAATEVALGDFDRNGAIRWIRLPEPSITHAMNTALRSAVGDVVLFVDDDIVPRSDLVEEHRRAHDDARLAVSDRAVVAGRVLQPWHVDGSRPPDRLASDTPGFVDEFIGCNFSVRRVDAIRVGGFDENFVRVAYRYEAEFAHRVSKAGMRILFAPSALIHHLHTTKGGTRSYGDHLRAHSPAHAVGACYFLLRTRPRGWLGSFLAMPFRAVATRFHLRNPWWIPSVMAAQIAAMIWATRLWVSGPRLIRN